MTTYEYSSFGYYFFKATFPMGKQSGTRNDSIISNLCGSAPTLGENCQYSKLVRDLFFGRVKKGFVYHTHPSLR